MRFSGTDPDTFTKSLQQVDGVLTQSRRFDNKDGQSIAVRFVGQNLLRLWPAPTFQGRDTSRGQRREIRTCVCPDGAIRRHNRPLRTRQDQRRLQASAHFPETQETRKAGI